MLPQMFYVAYQVKSFAAAYQDTQMESHVTYPHLVYPFKKTKILSSLNK